MELKDKGSKVSIDNNFNQLQAIMKWNVPVDFDLAAGYKLKDGAVGLIYFDNKGDLNLPPFMQAGKDEGIGGNVNSGGNEEKLTIAKFDAVDEIWLFGWDYDSMKKGKVARFSEDAVSMSVVDDKGNTHKATLDTKESGNVVHVATIKCSGIVPEYINISSAATLPNFPKDTDLLFSAFGLS